MQKEEKIVLMLLLMALASLGVSFWAFGPEDSGLGSSPVAKEDSSYSMEGVILDIKSTNNGGNLLLRLDNTPMPIFIPASAGAAELLKKVRTGNHVRIKGTVSQYMGKEELKVSRSTDVVLIRK
jgi:hypothetical protein